MRGKGGLGATIELWTLLIFAPYSLVTLGAIFFASYLITRKTYYAVIVTQIFLPFVLFYFERTAAWVVFGAVILIVFLLKYRKERDDFSYWTWSKRGIERKRP